MLAARRCLSHTASSSWRFAARLLPCCSSEAVPLGSRGLALFDRLIPEDDEDTKRQKALEREVIKKRLQRSNLAEMMTRHKDKVGKDVSLQRATSLPIQLLPDPAVPLGFYTCSFM